MSWCQKHRARELAGDDGSSLLVFLVIGAGPLVAAHIARVVCRLFPTFDALPFAALIKALLVGSGVLTGVCQPVDATHCGCFLQAGGGVGVEPSSFSCAITALPHLQS